MRRFHASRTCRKMPRACALVGGSLHSVALSSICGEKVSMASWRRCRCASHCYSFSLSRPFEIVAVRSFFGEWGASLSSVEGSSPKDEKHLLTHPSDGVSAAAPADHEALKRETQQLRQQIKDLKEALETSQEAVRQLLIVTASNTALPPLSEQSIPTGTASAATVPGDTPEVCVDCRRHGQGACYVVRTSGELSDALRGHGSESASRTILLDGTRFVLDAFAPVVVDRARVSIVGNNATIVGHIAVKGRGALLSVSDVFFLAPGDLHLHVGSETLESIPAAAGATTTASGSSKRIGTVTAAGAATHRLPVVKATAGAGVHLNRCTLSNGRDGVYLGMGSYGTLNHVRIVNCIRGLYEGVGCRTSMMWRCTFQANRYHVVLLGPNNVERAAQLFRCRETAVTGYTGAPGTAPPLKDAVGVTLPPPSTHLGSSAAPSADADEETTTTFSAVFATTASPADVLAPCVTCSSEIVMQVPKAQVVLEHNPITDIYESCLNDGVEVTLSEEDSTAGLSDPIF